MFHPTLCVMFEGSAPPRFPYYPRPVVERIKKTKKHQNPSPNSGFFFGGTREDIGVPGKSPLPAYYQAPPRHMMSVMYDVGQKVRVTIGPGKTCRGLVMCVGSSDDVSARCRRVIDYTQLSSGATELLATGGDGGTQNGACRVLREPQEHLAGPPL